MLVGCGWRSNSVDDRALRAGWLNIFWFRYASDNRTMPHKIEIKYFSVLRRCRPMHFGFYNWMHSVEAQYAMAHTTNANSCFTPIFLYTRMVWLCYACATGPADGHCQVRHTQTHGRDEWCFWQVAKWVFLVVSRSVEWINLPKLSAIWSNRNDDMTAFIK